MDKFKKTTLLLPEYLLLVSVFYYWILTGVLFNPIAMGLSILLTVQIILKNKVIGLAISGLLILSSLYMLLALFSELSEFSRFNEEAQQLLFFGLAYFLSILCLAGLMIYRIIKQEIKTVSY